MSFSMSFFGYSVVSIVVCLTLYTVFSSVRIARLIRESQVLVRSSVPYERMVAPEALGALFVGDSTGVGVGALSPEESLAGRFAKDFPEWNVVNQSVSGRKTVEIIPPLEALSERSFSLVVVQIGGNDITYFSNEGQLEKDIRRVIQEAKRVGGRAILLTCGNVASAPIFPRPLAFLWERKTLAVREIFMRVAREEVITYIDLYHEKKSDPFFLEPYRYHASDLFHPSSEGYGLWYEQFRKVL